MFVWDIRVEQNDKGWWAWTANACDFRWSASTIGQRYIGDGTWQNFGFFKTVSEAVQYSVGYLHGEASAKSSAAKKE